MKSCTRCKETKQESDFHKHTIASDGLMTICKQCRNLQRRENHKENPEKEYLYRQTENYKLSYQKCLAKRRAKKEEARLIYENSPEFLLKQQQKEEKDKEYHRNYVKKRCERDAEYKLRRTLRIRLYSALKNQAKTGSAVKDLGCTIPELKMYLEIQFQPEMTWENHGEWEIDHIKPLASFNLIDRQELLKACHFSNLQPLWRIDNQKKGNKISSQ